MRWLSAHHRRDRIRGRPPARPARGERQPRARVGTPRIVAPSRRRRDAGSGHVDGGRSARPRRGARRARRGRPSVIYHCAGVADVHRRLAGAGDGAPRQRRSAPTTCSRPRASWRSTLPRAGDRLGADLPPEPRAASTKRRRSAPASPYGVSKLAQEMTAAASPAAGAAGAAVQSRRPAAVADIRHLGLRAADCRDRGRPRASRCCASATSMRGATSPTCATPCAPTRRSRSAASRARPYNVCSGRAYSMRELLDVLLSLARVRVRIEIDPARLRPSDNPVVLGSHAAADAGHGLARRRSRSSRPSPICSNTGARATAHERPRPRRTPRPRASSCTCRWAPSRCCCDG